MLLLWTNHLLYASVSPFVEFKWNEIPSFFKVSPVFWNPSLRCTLLGVFQCTFFNSPFLKHKAPLCNLSQLCLGPTFTEPEKCGAGKDVKRSASPLPALRHDEVTFQSNIPQRIPAERILKSWVQRKRQKKPEYSRGVPISWFLWHQTLYIVQPFWL